jgi:hypothetical protein
LACYWWSDFGFLYLLLKADLWTRNCSYVDSSYSFTSSILNYVFQKKLRIFSSNIFKTDFWLHFIWFLEEGYSREDIVNSCYGVFWKFFLNVLKHFGAFIINEHTFKTAFLNDVS